MTARARDPGDVERPEPTSRPHRPEVESARRTGAAPTASQHTLMRLQARAGNKAVTRLVAQRARAAGRAPAPSQHRAAAEVQRLAEGGGATLAPPMAPTPADPKADPRFAAVAGTVDRSAKGLKKHPSGSAEAKKASNAAQAPPDDKAGQAKAAQADQMATAKPKGFDKAGFIAAVKQAIAKAAPQNLDEADKFATSGKADTVKGEVMGKVGHGKETSAQDVAAKTAQAPDPSVAKDKPVTPLEPRPAAQVPPVDGAKAMPGKAPAEQTDLRAGPAEVASTLAGAEVTDQHLAASNEPQMQQAAAAKQQAEAHAAQAPAQIRQKEGQVLQQAQAGAAADTRGAMAAMASARTSATGQVGVQQSAAKAKEETERARISGEINKIYDKTKGEVEGILTGLDAKVSQEFEKGEAEARRAFTAKHKADMERYKDQRYSGPAGWTRWTGDLFMSLPKEADQIFVQAKALYEERMTAVISGVADLIGRELDAAKTKIATGRQAIKDYVASQPKESQKIATLVAGEVNGKFDQLESDVDAKQESLVEDLAQKYVEARGAVDEEIKAEQAKNQGLVDMAKNAVGESVKSILALKDLFMGLLAKAASAFNLILAKPVQFITNFMSAVKQGFMNFASNILDHLKKGLQGWLFGQLANTGIELPEKFDLMGILKMVASLLGLTWTGIKARIAAKDPFLGKVIDTIQSKIEIFVVLATKGVVGVWDWIKEKVGDLKQLVFDQIKSFIIEKIVKAGITWVLGMLNPAGALIKIVQALISVVQWIMERGAEMGEFIGSIIDAVMDIARGGGGGVPAKIEAALGKAVPLVISFLAGLLGLGGVSEKVKSTIEKGQKLVGMAVDWVIGKAMKLARPLINAMKKGAAWVKGKYEAGKAWVKGKWEAGKAWAKKKIEAGKAWIKGKGAAPDKAVGPADDLRSQVKQALMGGLSRPHKRDEVTQIVAGIEHRFRGNGLRQIVIGNADSNGSYPILVEASPLAPAVLLRLIYRGWTVRAAATLRFAGPVTLETPRRFYPMGNRRGVVAHPGGGGAVRAAGSDPDLPGARIIHPEPGPDHKPLPARERVSTDVVQIVSQNFRLPPNAREHNNHSHAEYKLVQLLLRDIPKGSWGSLQSVRLDISRMPCAMCCQTLSEWLPRITQASVRIGWTSTHPERMGDMVDFPTSASDLALLDRPGVTRVGPGALFASAEEATRLANVRAVPVR